jgi:hypothetical protein
MIPIVPAAIALLLLHQNKPEPTKSPKQAAQKAHNERLTNAPPSKLWAQSDKREKP